jgi:hypothetical protein
MLKAQELSDPESCLNKAKSDEPVFTLRAHDITFSEMLAHWVYLRTVKYRKNLPGDMQIWEARMLAVEGEKYRESEQRAVSGS